MRIVARGAPVPPARMREGVHSTSTHAAAAASVTATEIQHASGVAVKRYARSRLSTMRQYGATSCGSRARHTANARSERMRNVAGTEDLVPA